MTRYVIDCGHGGSAPAGRATAYGTRGASGTLEKTVTLAIGQRVARALGRDAVLTRTGDYNLALAKRLAVAGAHRPVAFVSIHASDTAERGPETWTHAHGGPKDHLLARAIHGELCRLGGGDRGIRVGNLASIAPGALPRSTAACLVEVDSLGHPDGERSLRDPRTLDRIASAITRGLQRYGDGDTSTPRQPARCLSYDTVMASSYDAFEADVRDNWVATCVPSRTNDIHLERPLVNGNASLRAVWNSLSGVPVGTPITLYAQYTFNANGVEDSVQFTTNVPSYSYPPEDASPPPDPADRALAEIRTRKQRGDRTYPWQTSSGTTAESLDRLECLCTKMKDASSDCRVVLLDADTIENQYDPGHIDFDQIVTDFRTILHDIPPSSPATYLVDRLCDQMELAITIWRAICSKVDVPHEGGASTRLADVRHWIEERMLDASSIYSCMTPANP